MNKKILVGAAVAALIVALVAVTTLAPQPGGTAPGQDAPELAGITLSLDSISPRSSTERAAGFDIKFTATNPDSETALLQYVKYTVTADGKRIHVGLIGERPAGFVASSNFFTMLAGASLDLSDEFSVRNTGSDPEFWDALLSDRVGWSVEAEASYSYSSVVAGGEHLETFSFAYPAP